MLFSIGLLAKKLGNYRVSRGSEQAQIKEANG